MILEPRKLVAMTRPRSRRQRTIVLHWRSLPQGSRRPHGQDAGASGVTLGADAAQRLQQFASQARSPCAPSTGDASVPGADMRKRSNGRQSHRDTCTVSAVMHKLLR